MSNLSQMSAVKWFEQLSAHLDAPVLYRLYSDCIKASQSIKLPQSFLSQNSIRVDAQTGDVYFRPNDNNARRDLLQVVLAYNKTNPQHQIVARTTIPDIREWYNTYMASNNLDKQETEFLKTVQNIMSGDSAFRTDTFITARTPSELKITANEQLITPMYKLQDIIKLVRELTSLDYTPNWDDWDVINTYIDVHMVDVCNDYHSIADAQATWTEYAISSLINLWSSSVPEVKVANGQYDTRTLVKSAISKSGIQYAVDEILRRYEQNNEISAQFSENVQTSLDIDNLAVNVNVWSETDSVTISGKIANAFKVTPPMGMPFYVVELEQYTVIRGKIERCYTHIRLNLTGEGATFSPYSSEKSKFSTERGKAMIEMVKSRVSPKHTDAILVHEYEGPADVPGMFGPTTIHISGIVVYDPVGAQTSDLRRYNALTGSIKFSTVNSENDSDDSTSDNAVLEDDVSDFVLASMIPEYIAYSFASRDWVMCNVQYSSPLVHDQQNFSIKLVLNEQEKTNIKSIVTNLKTDFVDIVKGKGGGAIFLLYGPAGLGKTLTAEAVSAVCHSPLYKVTVGELGTNVAALEQTLGKVLNFASRWGATILIDEADIFLEARDSQNIERNAMVGVFLRLMEYYPGIMFLTTNRVANFDTAFFSRITYAIGFKEQTAEERTKVWNNLLSAANLSLTGDQITILSQSNVNNRQIKTAIANGQRFAMYAQVPCDYSHIAQALKGIVAFNKEVFAKPEHPQLNG